MFRVLVRDQNEEQVHFDHIIAFNTHGHGATTLPNAAKRNPKSRSFSCLQSRSCSTDREQRLSQTCPPTMTNARKIRAAVVQACSAAFSLHDTLEKLKKYAQEASEKGAHLAVFPEAL